MGFDYQSITHSDCHNCDGISVFCDNHCDRIRPDLEESSARRLQLLGQKRKRLVFWIPETCQDCVTSFTREMSICDL